MTAAMLAAAALSLGPDDTPAVLARVREALHDRALSAQSAGIMVRGRAKAMGEEGDYSLVFDAQGRFAMEVSSRLPRTLAFDGKTAWEVDFQGTRRVLELGDRAKGLLSVWSITGQWLTQGTSLHFADRPTPDGDGALSIAFDLDEKRTTGEVRISTITWLPERFTWTSGGRTQKLTLSNYAERAGVMLPGSVEDDKQGSTDVYTLSSAAPAPAFLRSPYEPRLGIPPGRFGTGPNELEVRKASTGHLLVKPMVAGKDLGYFIFDTGAGNTVIDPAAAKQAGLEPFGSVDVVGVGGGTPGAFYRPEHLTLGLVTVDAPLMVGTDLSFLTPHMGVPIAGVIGYDVLCRCISEIDLSAGKVSLFNPASFTLSRGQWTDMILYGRHPCVAGAFEGHTCVFKLDTGANGDVTIHAPAVREFKLLEGRETKPAGLGGVGGMVQAAAGKLATLEVGGKTFENVSATFATEAKGAFGDTYTAGNIGGGIIGKFVLVVDLGGRRIAFLEKPDTSE